MKRVGLALALLAILAIAGCQNAPNIVTPGSIQPGMINDPGNVAVTVDSAYFWIYITEPTGQIINVHEVTADWSEMAVTWNSLAAAYDTAVYVSFAADADGWKRVDITALVQAWMDGTTPNYGLLLEQDDTTLTLYHSSEAADQMLRPKFEICTSEGGQQDCFTIQRGLYQDVFDAFIWEAFPSDNYGRQISLYTGRHGEGEKQTLVMADLTEIMRNGAIGDLVWCDENMNGIQDEREPGLPRITVHLLNCEDSILAETHTNEMGNYYFESLMPGNYKLHFVLPEGLSFTLPNQGDNDCHDSDVDTLTGYTDCTSIDSGEVDLCWDAGILCQAPPDSGCTRSKGYWKNHAGFGPQDDVVTPLLPIWLGTPDGNESILADSAQIAYDILTQHVYGEPSNGISKLYAQLLAAKLNIASGASDDDVEDVIGDADEFLAENSWEDWSDLTRDEKNMVLGWKDMLDGYNNGIIGPGHCDDDDSY
jgi:hypothetical protein